MFHAAPGTVITSLNGRILPIRFRELPRPQTIAVEFAYLNSVAGRLLYALLVRRNEEMAVNTHP